MSVCEGKRMRERDSSLFACECVLVCVSVRLSRDFLFWTIIQADAFNFCIFSVKFLGCHKDYLSEKLAFSFIHRCNLTTYFLKIYRQKFS